MMVVALLLLVALPLSHPLARGFGKASPPPAPSLSQTSPSPRWPNFSAPVEEALSIISADPAKYISVDPSSYEFFALLPLLLSTKFPSTPFPRVQSFLHTYLLLSNIKDPALKATLLPPSIVSDPLRPHEDVHAFMDGLPSPSPFLARPAALAQLPLVALLEKNAAVVKSEFEALSAALPSQFQTLTSLNYKAGWSTLLTHTNGHH